MTEGCWVQFWHDDNCSGPTLRIDATGGTLLINNLDDYVQSNGRQEGNEPDSLKTGARTWLVVYKDKDYGGTNAMFGPNSEIDDLDKYKMGRNISSVKLYDTRPPWFVDSALGNPFASESNDSLINASTVNNLFRTAVAAATSAIPGVGGIVSSLVKGLWPVKDKNEQVWASFQNYLNQAIAGVYWQLKYESLNNALQSLFNAAEDFVDTSVLDALKKEYFSNLRNLVKNYEPFFVDETAPEKKFSFLVPFASLQLATLRENLDNYEYYYGEPPSPELAETLKVEIHEAVAKYQGLLASAKTRIIERRVEMIKIEDGLIIDFYNGVSISLDAPNSSRDYYVDSVVNKLALKLDEHNATGQLWTYFDPSVTGPVQPPILNYAMGPYGQYLNHEGANFSQKAESGQEVTGIALWTSQDVNGDLTQALELYVAGVAKGRVGGSGGTRQSLTLEPDERFDFAEGSANHVRYLYFSTNRHRYVYSGDKNRYPVQFQVAPLPDTTETRLVGVSGYASASVDAVTLHWSCKLLLQTEN